MQVNCFEIAHGSSQYHETVRLRDELLRKPLGMKFHKEDLAKETDSFHLVAYNEEKELLACLILTPLNPLEIKMRQVATAAKWQGKGIGKKLVTFAEKFSQAKGYQNMVLNARETAIPFYDGLAYQAVGKRFEEVSIPHQKMQKRLKNI